MLVSAAAAAAAAAAFALLAAGCGGGGSSGGVNAATTAAQNELVAYSACMRSDGVPNFPDPSSSGGIPKQDVVSAFQAAGNSRAEAASSACRHLLPAGGSLSGQAAKPVTAQDRQDYLGAAACMRSHGVPGFPDPTFHGNGVQTDIPSSIDQDSSQFESAATICTKQIPAGLPYGDTSGG
jgi:hypothetical protein